MEALCFHKQQHEALGSQVKQVTRENKEKENILKYLKLVNMKNAFLLKFKKFRQKTS